MRAVQIAFLTAVVLFAGSALAHVHGAGRSSLRVGQTEDLVPHARWPVRWEGNDKILFETWTGVAVARITGTGRRADVSDRRYPSYNPGRAIHAPPRGIRLPLGTRYGRWRAWSTGVGSTASYLTNGDETCGPPLLRSPDRRFVACLHVVTEPWHETSSAFGAVVRVD